MGGVFSVPNVLQVVTFTRRECPFWGRTFDSFVETALDPTTGDTYRFISVSSFDDLARFKNPLITEPLLIRDEYERLYNFCSQESPELPTRSNHGIAVIGHPGIGKSLFLWYALFRRVCEAKPTAFQYEPNQIWIFNGMEAQVRTPDSAQYGADLPNGAWALSDSNALLRGLSPFMASKKFLTIQATSSQEDHYRQWVKEKGGFRYYVEIFSEREIKQLGHLLRAPTAIDMYHRWGPSARNCIGFAQRGKLEVQHDWLVRSAVKLLAREPPERVPPDEGLSVVVGSHSLFCTRPMPGELGYLSAQSTVISPHVQLIIQAEMVKAEHKQRKRFYNIISVHPHCRSVMGWLLEQQFHRWIGLDAVSRTCDSLECKAPNRRRNQLPPLHLKPAHEEPLNGVEELATAERLSLPIYYRPTSERLPGVDGLMLTSDAIVLIQVTVSSKHKLKREHLLPLYQNLPPGIRNRPWKFVWAVPEDDIGEVLVNRKFDVLGSWPQIEFYWCRFPFDTRPGASEGLELDIETEEDEADIEMWEGDEDET